jgi:uncharacterized protein YdbL (DUF1318 family)
MKTMLFRSVFFLFALCLVSLVRAEDLSTVKARMDQRLPQVQALKTQGAIGENNRGFLEYRGGPAESGAIIAAENKDRETVYAALAQKVGGSMDQVGKKRAAKIAQNSRPGEWLQDDAGNWKKK